MSKRSRQKDRPRIIGTFVERLLLHQLAQEVFIRLPELHHELDVEFEYFAHIPIGFLREPADRLWGFCSLSQEKRGSYATLHREKNRTHRILISRVLMHDDLHETLKTIHHEFVHALLGKEIWKAEKHGPIFEKHDSRWTPELSNDVIGSNRVIL